MSENRNFLRPEASPVPYWKHNKRAKDALNFIIRILKGAAEGVEEKPGIAGDLSIDTNRASRIFFVSGEPGSGKSTLYLTLRAMLNSESNEYQEGYHSKYNAQIDLAGLKNVRWLDTLDLEVAGDEGENLLAGVLVRLFRKLDESKPIHSKDCEDAIKKLEELATDIGIAWEGNLLARAGNLDPDTYSAEVIRTQGARLRINNRLQEALDELAKEKCYGCSGETLFILPVDDFYLKPAASLELLRLLRMISIPRLFFLVMGDIKTVEALFIEKSLADWTGVAGPPLFAARSERLDDALTRASELRARYLRKLLPPGQRSTIEPMDWYEALNFELSHPNKDHADTEILEELLVKVKLDRPWNASESDEGAAKFGSLLEFLLSPPLPPILEGEKLKRQKRSKRAADAEKEPEEQLALRKHRSAYTALQILDATPREMMDLGFALREVIRRRQELKDLKNVAGETEDSDSDRIPVLLSCVRDLVDLVREEQSFTNDKGQKVLEGILPTRQYSPEDINFEMNRLLLTPSARPWRRQELAPGKDLLWTRNHRSWDLQVNSDQHIDAAKNKQAQPEGHESIEQAPEDPFAKLPPRPAAWFVLLHDLAWEWKTDSVSVNLIKRLCEELDEWNAKRNTKRDEAPAETISRSGYLLIGKAEQTPDPAGDFPGWAIRFDGQEHSFEHFPMPVFETFRDLDRFLFIWSSGLEWLRKHKGEPTLNQLLGLWEVAGLTILKDAIHGEVWYGKFAQGGAQWYDNLEERLKEIQEQPDPALPWDEHLEELQRRLTAWAEKLESFKKKITDGQQSAPSAPPQN
jgi:energy-coupling factor transporter ATP-binding protein EcfA2